MPRRIVIVSDLHVGRGKKQDDFREYTPAASGTLGEKRDAQFNTFCRAMVAQAPGDELTFVLNGDIIDFWEVAEDDELAGSNAVATIKRNLITPQMNPAQQQAAINYAKRQIAMALGGHPVFCRTLRYILEKAKVVYLFGNHDHVMVSKDVQDGLREYLEQDGHTGLANPTKLTFAHLFEDKDLGVYIEHGNQFSSGTSDVSEPNNWQEQGLGYYGLRFIWNRIQAEYGIVKPSTEEALDFARAIIRKQTASGEQGAMQRKTFQYLIDYFMAYEAGLVPRLVDYFTLVYNIWKNNGRPATPAEFFTQPVKEELAHKDDDKPTTGPKSEAEEGPGHPDQYLRGVTRRFRHAPKPFKLLDRKIHRRLFLGHTHKRRDMKITPTAANKLFDHHYLNTASWTRDLKRPYFGYAYEQDGDVQFGVKPV